jgi:hypothetical protein
MERKGLKQVERKGLKEGFKVAHQIMSITWINQTMLFQVSRMVLWRDVTSPFGRGLPPLVGKSSLGLGRLTWKW